MLMIDENHHKAMIGKYVPVERIADFKKDLISETVSDEEIRFILYALRTEIKEYGGYEDEDVTLMNKTIEKLKRRGP